MRGVLQAAELLERGAARLGNRLAPAFRAREACHQWPQDSCRGMKGGRPLLIGAEPPPRDRSPGSGNQPMSGDPRPLRTRARADEASAARSRSNLRPGVCVLVLPTSATDGSVHPELVE